MCTRYISAVGRVQYPKNGFLRGSINSILTKYVSGKANVLYAHIRHFWTITLRDATPFKEQVNFDIPIFEGKIYADALERWLNMLEGYLSIHNFSDRENITFALLKVVPHIKHWWKTYCEQNSIEEPRMFEDEPTWEYFMDGIKE
jgi:hypothetical protein